MAYNDPGVNHSPEDRIGYDEPRGASFFSALIGRRPVDTFAIATITLLGLGVVINAVAFQKAPHPAPMFAPARTEVQPALITDPPLVASTNTLTAADSMMTAAVTPPARPLTMQSLAAGNVDVPVAEERMAPALDRNLVVNVQQELVRHGFLSSASDVDGQAGPRTESAIKQYQNKARLDATGEVTDDLLIHLRKSATRARTPAQNAPLSLARVMAQPAPRPQQAMQVPAARPKSVAARSDEPLSVTPVRNAEITASIAPRPQSVVKAAAPAADRPAAGRGLGPLFASVDAQPAKPVVNRTMLSAERALARAGYGPLKVDGIYDEHTRAAIMRFERDQQMPVTGQLSATVIKALARNTGESFN